MFKDLKVIETIPDQEWLNRLRKDNYIYLVKEKTFGIVEWEFEPPEPGTIAGRLGFKKYGWGSTQVGDHQQDWVYQREWVNQTWIVRANGCGLDFKSLILPVEGHLADDPPPLDEPVIRQMKRTIANLEHRVLMLERGLWLADSLNGLTPSNSYPRKRP